MCKTETGKWCASTNNGTANFARGVRKDFLRKIVTMAAA